MNLLRTIDAITRFHGKIYSHPASENTCMVAIKSGALTTITEVDTNKEDDSADTLNPKGVKRKAELEGETSN